MHQGWEVVPLWSKQTVSLSEACLALGEAAAAAEGGRQKRSLALR